VCTRVPGLGAHEEQDGRPHRALGLCVSEGGCALCARVCPGAAGAARARAVGRRSMHGSNATCLLTPMHHPPTSCTTHPHRRHPPAHERKQAGGGAPTRARTVIRPKMGFPAWYSKMDPVAAMATNTLNSRARPQGRLTPPLAACAACRVCGGWVKSGRGNHPQGRPMLPMAPAPAASMRWQSCFFWFWPSERRTRGYVCGRAC